MDANQIHEISVQEWNRKRKHGYAHLDSNGRRWVLTLDRKTGATVIQGVKLLRNSK